MWNNYGCGCQNNMQKKSCYCQHDHKKEEKLEYKCCCYPVEKPKCCCENKEYKDSFNYGNNSWGY